MREGEGEREAVNAKKGAHQKTIRHNAFRYIIYEFSFFIVLHYKLYILNVELYCEVVVRRERKSPEPKRNWITRNISYSIIPKRNQQRMKPTLVKYIIFLGTPSTTDNNRMNGCEMVLYKQNNAYTTLWQHHPSPPRVKMWCGNTAYNIQRNWQKFCYTQNECYYVRVL